MIQFSVSLDDLSLDCDRAIYQPPASMVFSTSSATALSGFCCDSAMIVMPFQSSPIFSFPPSRVLRFLVANFQSSRVSRLRRDAAEQILDRFGNRT